MFFWKSAGREYVYIMWSWQFPVAAKIGVTDSPMRRRKEISISISKKLGYDVELLVLPIPLFFWTYRFETVLHNSKPLRKLKFNGLKGTDGYSEWFWCCNPIFVLLFIPFCYRFDLNMLHWCVVFLLPCLPLDAILITLVLAGAQWVFAGMVLWGLFEFIF